MNSQHEAPRAASGDAEPRDAKLRDLLYDLEFARGQNDMSGMERIEAAIHAYVASIQAEVVRLSLEINTLMDRLDLTRQFTAAEIATQRAALKGEDGNG